MWHLLGKVFFEEVHLIADLLPQKVLTRIEAIEEKNFMRQPTHLSFGVLRRLLRSSGINARYLVLVNTQLYQLLMQ